jgi:hypothetical protein
MVFGAFQYNAVLSDAQILARHRAMKSSERAMPVAPYLDGTCMVFEGVSISRRNVIEYVANRVGGVHFDPSRDGSRVAVEAQFKALDQARSQVELASMDGVYFELLSIGQALLASPEVAELREDPA